VRPSRFHAKSDPSVARVLPATGSARLRLLRAATASAFLLGAGLRLTGLTFGQGALTARPDEELLRTAAWYSLSGDLNPHYAVWGHLFHYGYVLVGMVLLGIQVLSGHHPDWWDAMAAAYEDSSAHFWLGRLLSATFGTAGIAALYNLARRTTGSSIVATNAVLILSCLFLHVRDSHFATCDILLATVVTWALAGFLNGSRPHAAAWRTALALSVKLSALPLIAAALAAWMRAPVGFSKNGSWVRWAELVRKFSLYLFWTLLFWILLQPFLSLDLRETWNGIVADIFNPERRPFWTGVHGKNASILGRYYMPQAFGWEVGVAALGGIVYSLQHPARRSGSLVLLTYLIFSLAAFLTVERIFLRYLDPLLPLVALYAGWGCAAVAQLMARYYPPLRPWSWLLAVAMTVTLASGNLVRSMELGQLLRAKDTRLLAKEWLQRRAAEQGRPLPVLWAGFGAISPHLTMPWVRPSAEDAEAFLAQWQQEGAPEPLVAALRIRWCKGSEPRIRLVAWRSTTPPCRETPPAQAYPGSPRAAPLPGCLERWSTRIQQLGWLCPFHPRLFVVRSVVVSVLDCPVELVSKRPEPVVVLTSMPYERTPPPIEPLLRQGYRCVASFGPGPRATEAVYDHGDAWWVPSSRISAVERPGPMIWIFERADLEARPKEARLAEPLGGPNFPSSPMGPALSSFSEVVASGGSAPLRDELPLRCCDPTSSRQPLTNQPSAACPVQEGLRLRDAAVRQGSSNR
jgi:hypothetical protein